MRYTDPPFILAMAIRLLSSILMYGCIGFLFKVWEIFLPSRLKLYTLWDIKNTKSDFEHMTFLQVLYFGNCGLNHKNKIYKKANPMVFTTYLWKLTL
jgi:hypothetical protein